MDKHGKSWLSGPQFLRENEGSWYATSVQPLGVDDAEIKHSDTFVGVSTIQKLDIDVTRYSSWAKVVRVISWVKRICKNVKAKVIKTESERRKGPLSVDEILEAESLLFQIIQRSEFLDEYANLVKGESIPKKSKLYQLSPHLDKDGIIRVGGRIHEAAISSMKKHHIILPGQHHLVSLLVKLYHDKTHHGTEYVLSDLRQSYWIVSARTLIKKIARQCLQCKKMKAKPITPYMCNLPAFHLDYSQPPFTHTGVDFLGTLFIKQRQSRLKRWGCLFVGMVTRAIHLELVEAMDTDSFINTLQRFINRRGRPNTILSDCGSNFKGAVNELKLQLPELNQEKISNFTVRQNIQWKFNPPSAPHMGGCWERLVQTVKRASFHMIKDRVLTDFQMLTVFTEVEVMVNNRPLTANSDDVKDLEALTPNHFISGRNFCNNSHFGEIRSNGLCSRKRWRQVQYVAEQFWKRWLWEYLPTLTRRTKWLKEDKNVEIGDLVMLQEDNVKRGSWPLGRIENICPGSDGVVRIGMCEQNPVFIQNQSSRYILWKIDLLMRFLKVGEC